MVAQYYLWFCAITVQSNILSDRTGKVRIYNSMLTREVNLNSEYICTRTVLHSFVYLRGHSTELSTGNIISLKTGHEGIHH